MEQNRTTAPERKRRTNKKAEEAVETQGEATAADAPPPAAETADEGLDERMLAALHAASDQKAHDLLALDLRPVASFTDFFLIGSAQNTRQVQAIADAVEEALRAVKIKPANVEGYKRAEWILMDYFTFIVHVFTPLTRDFYSLERLWGDAERIEVSDEPPARSQP